MEQARKLELGHLVLGLARAFVGVWVCGCEGKREKMNERVLFKSGIGGKVKEFSGRKPEVPVLEDSRSNIRGIPPVHFRPRLR